MGFQSSSWKCLSVVSTSPALLAYLDFDHRLAAAHARTRAIAAVEVLGAGCDIVSEYSHLYAKVKDYSHKDAVAH